MKSPEPPIPFIILVPSTWVEFTHPNMSASVSRVHGDYAETADNFRVVGNFGGAEHDFVVEEVEVGKQLCLNLVGECHGACAGECALACAKQFKHGILYNFRVHHEVGEFLVETQVIEHCIGHVAHAALQGRNSFGMRPLRYSLTRKRTTLAPMRSDTSSGLVKLFTPSRALVRTMPRTFAGSTFSVGRPIRSLGA